VQSSPLKRTEPKDHVSVILARYLQPEVTKQKFSQPAHSPQRRIPEIHLNCAWRDNSNAKTS
jgi:hypothetical protein